MKKLIFLFFLLSFIFPLTLESSALEISLNGGAEVYSDSIGFGGMVGVHSSLKGFATSLQESPLGSLFLGVSGFYFQGKKDEVRVTHIGGGLDIGYEIFIISKLRLIPFVFAGFSKGKAKTDDFVSIDSLGYSLMPGLILDYEVVPNFLLGVRAGYQLYGYTTKDAEVSGSIRGISALLKIGYRF